MQNKFFGSKLNSILLLILIILMIIAIRFMFKNQKVYLPMLNNKQIIKNTIAPQDQLLAIPWNTIISNNEKIYYDDSWIATGISNDPDSTTFILPSGATVFRGGRQSECSENTYEQFEYGVSNTACIKGLRSDLTHRDVTGNISIPITLKEKQAFGDFVLKNK